MVKASIVEIVPWEARFVAVVTGYGESRAKEMAERETAEKEAEKMALSEVVKKAEEREGRYVRILNKQKDGIMAPTCKIEAQVFKG